MRPRAAQILAFQFLLLLSAGCGKNLPIAPASGTITLGGKPLVGATITTQPIGVNSQNPGPGSFGHTDANGRFELEIVKPAVKGAIIGQHRVMVSPPSNEHAASGLKNVAGGERASWTDDPQGNRTAVGDKWPTKFTDGSLTMEVPAGGTDQLRFDLTQ